MQLDRNIHNDVWKGLNSHEVAFQISQLIRRCGLYDIAESAQTEYQGESSKTCLRMWYGTALFGQFPYSLYSLQAVMCWTSHSRRSQDTEGALMLGKCALCLALPP